MLIKPIQQVLLFSFLVLLNGCISQFIPETAEDPDLLVVEGIITDQDEPNTIKLSRSQPLGERNSPIPVTGFSVTISDDLGNNYTLRETVAGSYQTDPANFRGIVGRTYTLHLRNNASYNSLTYQSFPMEMKQVPPIDSIYYEKMAIQEKYKNSTPSEGCQIYLNTHDPQNTCKFYRWEYSETWEFRLPYTVPNNICWISSNSDKINIKSTSSLAEDRINNYPLDFVSNTSDRLKVKYSILVNQYSLNEDEYVYWEKLQAIGEQVGGLYDITPASIPSNIWCNENPNESVLGYFSVSATKSKRLFIKDNFSGIINLYTDCIADTVFGGGPSPNQGISSWVIIDNFMPPYKVYTYSKGCADCSVRGTTQEPVFWKDDQ